MSSTEPGGLNRDLVCVLFPGIVKNDEKAIQCLGGITGISQVYSQITKKRLGLSFQPENPYVRRVFADTKQTSGVLLKVKVRKVKQNNSMKREVISTDVLGKVTKIFKFESMCDFQYLPIQKNEATGQTECILEQILPSGLDNTSFLTEPSSTFIVPTNFTRSDKTISYAYTDRKNFQLNETKSDNQDDYHKKSRSDRAVPLTHIWTFNLESEFPTKPEQCYVNYRDEKYGVNPVLKKEFEIVEKCFQERPIWSSNLIKYHTKIRAAHLKMLLPCIAILMRNGPWKKMWVKYGYDPRKEPGARMYQTLDFRLRHIAGAYSVVMCRDQVSHHKKADRVRQLHRKNRTEPLPSEDVKEGTCYFRPGLIPAQRQIFYQMCDIELPEVKAMLVEEPPPDRKCSKNHGWLLPNTIDSCRDRIFECMQQTLLSIKNTNLKLEEALSSDDEDNSDNDQDDSMANEIDEIENT